MTDTNNATNNKPRFIRKPGRTLLVQQTSDSFDSTVLQNLEGLTSSYHTERSNSYFLTFESLPHSLSVYRDLRANHSETVRVKFAHYRVFFTLQGLQQDTDYSNVKTAHTSYINDNLNGNVLYYKLYRKEGSYLDCGELTLDTKESLDLLVSADENHKELTLTVDSLTLSGNHFRYNRKGKKEDSQMSSNVVLN